MKTIFTIAFVVAGHCSFGQGEMYRLVPDNYLYSEIHFGEVCLSANKYADTIALGFDITVAGVTNDTLYITLRGDISTAGTAYDLPHFCSFNTLHSNGTYKYEIVGNPGSRIVKLQFKNIKFDYDQTGADFMNYQVWLYEEDKTIAVHFGKSSVKNTAWSYYFNAEGAAIGMKNLWLKGNTSAPETDVNEQVRLKGTPENGQIYQFAYKPVGMSDQRKPNDNKIEVYPNPVKDWLFINTTENATIVLTDLSGRTLIRSAQHNNGIDMHQLQPGIYLLYVNDHVFKILK